MKTTLALSLLTLLASACQVEEGTNAPRTEDSAHASSSKARPASARTSSGETALATFAGGCFWCMEKPFEELPGVSAVISGYTGGHKEDPTYEEVCSGTTGHAESIEVHFDPAVLSYEDLLEVFWRQVDPTDSGGQFVDRGNQYRSEIFYHDPEQRAEAEASKRALAESGRFGEPIVTAITPATTFYPAEDYHQDYYLKNPEHYHRYRSGSGRDRFLDRVWGADRKYVPVGRSAAAWEDFVKPSDDELREALSSLQYKVTQQEGTERPFENEYWDNKHAGIYVDVVSGEPLFSSRDKFASGTGWPSFSRPLVEENLQFDTDRKLGYTRDEVRSRHADSHLGHVFEDGPPPTGLRYCINSAALRFVPKEDMEAEGYGAYLSEVE